MNRRFLLVASACLLVMGAAGQIRRPSMLRSIRSQKAAQEAAPSQEEAKAAIKNAPKGTNGVPALVFNQTPLELVLDAYAEQCGKTIIPAPDLPKSTITLTSLPGQLLTKDEYLEAIEVTLTMNGVVLEPFGEKFLRALQRKTLRTQGNPILMSMPEGALPEKGKVVSQMIRLQHITAEEAQKAIEGFKDPNGLFQVFERTNTILVTDTQENVNRMLEVIKELDVATPVTEDVFVRQIEYAVANDIKTALETIVTESQKETQKETSGAKTAGGLGFGKSAPPAQQPGRLLNLNNRPGLQKPEVPVNTPNANLVAAVSDADRGMIRGKVLILADERSNKLIVITNKANMDFFDKVIETLDVETTPEVSVEVIRLKYADAEEVSSMLNDLIGNGSSSSQGKNNQNANTQLGGSANRNLTTGSRPGVAPHTQTPRPQTANPTFAKNSSSLGELNKDNVKILADKRINGIIVMARKADMKAVKEVIEDMDVKLSQVLIETVIVQVELGDDLTTGIDWVRRGKYRQKVTRQLKDSSGNPLYYDSDGKMTTEETDKKVMETITRTVRDGFFNNGSATTGRMLSGGGGAASGTLAGLVGTATSTSTSGGTSSSEDEDEESLISTAGSAIAAGAVGGLPSTVNPIGGGINYFLKSDKLNLAAVIQASKSDSRTKVLASPILMTVDNKEATIEATDMIYLFSGYQYSGSTYSGTQVRNYEKRDIGLTVKVTPRINPNGTVVLTVEQTFETQGADQNVPNESGGTDPYATVTTRKISSDVSVENRQTVVMGGLTKKTNVESESGIPILKDIPWIGKWLFGSVAMKEARSELLVFMTPYVLDDADAAQAEALRRKKVLSDPRPWDDNGWSTSPLADPISKKEQLRRLNEEWKRQDEERKTQQAIEKAKVDRIKLLKGMTDDERKFWMELHKKELEDEAKENKAEQDGLREIVEDIKSRKMKEAETAIEQSKAIEKNEYQKMVEEKAKDDVPPRGELLKKDVEAAKKRNAEEAKADPAPSGGENLLGDLSPAKPEKR